MGANIAANTGVMLVLSHLISCIKDNTRPVRYGFITKCIKLFYIMWLRLSSPYSLLNEVYVHVYGGSGRGSYFRWLGWEN